jgi:hypothetical protein
MICPLASIRPAICDGLPLITRFSATADDDGWTKSTVCCAPTSKLCQLIAVRWLDCVIVVVLALVPIEALPAVTMPPLGCAFAAGCARAGVATSSVATVPSAVRDSNVARPRNASGSHATCQRAVLVIAVPPRPTPLARTRRKRHRTATHIHSRLHRMPRATPRSGARAHTCSAR